MMKHIIKFTDEELDALHGGMPPLLVNPEWDREQVITSLVGQYKATKRYAEQIGRIMAIQRKALRAIEKFTDSIIADFEADKSIMGLMVVIAARTVNLVAVVALEDPK
jgi:hypothetical protein